MCGYVVQLVVLIRHLTGLDKVAIPMHPRRGPVEAESMAETSHSPGTQWPKPFE